MWLEADVSVKSRMIHCSIPISDQMTCGQIVKEIEVTIPLFIL